MKKYIQASFLILAFVLSITIVTASEKSFPTFEVVDENKIATDIGIKNVDGDSVEKNEKLSNIVEDKILIAESETSTTKNTKLEEKMSSETNSNNIYENTVDMGQEEHVDNTSETDTNTSNENTVDTSQQGDQIDDTEILGNNQGEINSNEIMDFISEDEIYDENENPILYENEILVNENGIGIAENFVTDLISETNISEQEAEELYSKIKDVELNPYTRCATCENIVVTNVTYSNPRKKQTVVNSGKNYGYNVQKATYSVSVGKGWFNFSATPTRYYQFFSANPSRYSKLIKYDTYVTAKVTYARYNKATGRYIGTSSATASNFLRYTDYGVVY